jgi:hypothetical protein
MANQDPSLSVILYSDQAFENWDWENPDGPGIGGSETSHIELCWRLARRGHTVTSYAPVGWKGVREWRGTKWQDVKDADFTLPGTWILYRNPAILDKFPNPHPGQRLCLIMQDVDYGSAWTSDRMAKLDEVWPLCQTHADYVAGAHPPLKNKIWITSNGIRMDMIREVSQEPPYRNPRKLVYASSPDRGLEALLTIFTRAREWVSDLELHVFYGFDNMDKLIAAHPNVPYYNYLKDRISGKFKQPGVFWRGRIGQRALVREWLSAGMWVYPSTFTETSCITSMDSQACGAIPITNPIWAVGENVTHGVFIEGDPLHDSMVRSRYVAEIYKLAANPAMQESIRIPMMLDAKVRFNWERVVDQVEMHLLGLLEGSAVSTHYPFQVKHATGKILNIGCDEDPCKFGERGAVNVDITDTNPVMGYKTAAHAIHDVRLPMPYHREFDSVILGDVIEHIELEEIPAAIHNAALAVKPGGKLIVGFPDDHRTVAEQSMWNGANGTELYATNSHALHLHRMDLEHVENIIAAEGLEIEQIQVVDYGLYTGWGILARVPEEISAQKELSVPMPSANGLQEAVERMFEQL